MVLLLCLNTDLWQKLLELTGGKKIEWRLVEGHVGIAGNSRSDEIATAFADGKNPKLYDGPLSGYPVRHILEIKAGKVAAPAHRAGAAVYSYVSLTDGVIKTHKTWAECEKRVRGKPAKFRKVFSQAEEEQLIEEFAKITKNRGETSELSLDSKH